MGVSPTVRVGDGTAAGAGYTATIASNISGAGSLEKTDLGTLVLTGTNTYRGATSVSNGALVVNGSVAGLVTLASGARFGGSGSIGGLVAGSQAVVAPGDSIGTLTVAGNVAFAADSTYEVESTPGAIRQDRGHRHGDDQRRHGQRAGGLGRL